MSYWKKTRTKIMALLIATIGVFACVFLGYQNIKNHQETLFNKASQEYKGQIIENLFQFKLRSYFGPVNDNSCWDEMVSYVKHPQKEWAKNNLSPIESFGFSNTWIFDQEYNQVYSAFDSSVFDKQVVIPKEVLVCAFKDSGTCHFFLKVNNSVMEVFGGSVVPSNDLFHKTKAQGYFLAAKFWDIKYIQALERETGFSVSFRKPYDTAVVSNEESSVITVPRQLRDVEGNTILIADFTSSNKFAAELSSSNNLSYALILLLGLTLAIFFFSVRSWISIPLAQITKSLSRESEQFVADLDKKGSEFGEIAKLIKQFFDQKKHLEVEIAERIESQKRVVELYEDTINLNHELQASEEELTQNLEMSQQLNEMLTKHQRSITDSINYASRIQKALLPTAGVLNQLERDYFIVNKPHSIVSGDFYWLSKKGEKLVLAVADCTGHGVPGGFMSMLGMAYLNEIVNQCETPVANEILEELRRRVVDSLHQNEEGCESRDGMDIALCIIDVERMHLQFSGAHNSLYIVRNTTDEGGSVIPEITELKGDRTPIGFSYKMDSMFTNSEISLVKNDMLYLFTDGYQDQMSSINQEKFKRKRLNVLLQHICNQPVVEQGRIVDNTFEEYRGNYRQVDDVLVFGMRI